MRGYQTERMPLLDCLAHQTVLGCNRARVTDRRTDRRTNGQINERMSLTSVGQTLCEEITDQSVAVNSGVVSNYARTINMDANMDHGIHSCEGRIALTKMVMRLFALWQIKPADQATLLSRSLKTLQRYKSGGCIADDEEMLDRVGLLLRIHKYS